MNRRNVHVGLAVVFAVAWATIDHPLEGPVVLKITWNHGIHLGDPLGLIPLVVLLRRRQNAT